MPMKDREKAALTKAQDNLLKCMPPEIEKTDIAKAFRVMEETFSEACEQMRAVEIRESRMRTKND